MQNSLIFDIGCHNGDDSDFYLRKGFRVVAVEANPDLCDLLRRRFETALANGRLILIDRAIAEHEGEVDFFSYPTMNVWGTTNPNWASAFKQRGAHALKVKVPSTTFDSLIKRYGMPYFMKIDIEGSDQLCLDGLLSFSERPQFISTEIEGREQIADLTTCLARLGYGKFKIVDQAQVPRLALPFPAREGIYVKHKFPDGASGPFGNELNGLWASRVSTVCSYYTIAARNRIMRWVGDKNTHWYDIHAALA